MIMKRITLIFSIFLFAFFSLNAQQSDEKALKILDKVSQNMKNYKTIYAEFGFELKNSQENVDDKRGGKVWVKGDKYKVDMGNVQTYFDGKNVWTYIKESNEVNITTPDEDDDEAINPAKIFDIYKEGYKVRFIQDRFEDTRPLYVIDLYPTDKSKSFSRIRLKIDKSKNEIYEFDKFDKDGNIYIIKLFRLYKNKPLSYSMFIFDKKKHPGVEVIDLRD
jgi:outer membrane lipoprotein-sorting protein